MNEFLRNPSARLNIESKKILRERSIIILRSRKFKTETNKSDGFWTKEEYKHRSFTSEILNWEKEPLKFRINPKNKQKKLNLSWRVW